MTILAAAYYFSDPTNAGVWKYDGSSWTKLTGSAAGEMYESAGIALLWRAPDGTLIATTNGDFAYWHSTDNGVTWTNNTGESGGEFDPKLATTDNLVGFDESKALWDELFSDGSDVHTSTDYGVTWTDKFARVHTGSTITGYWASRGHVWSLEQYSSTPKVMALVRDGAAIGTDPVSTGSGDVDIGCVQGLFGSDSVWLQAQTDFGGAGEADALWRYDGSLTSLTLPVRPDPTSFVQRVVVMEDGMTMFASMWKTETSYQQLFRSTDGGSTWSLVLDDARFNVWGLHPGVRENASDPTDLVTPANGGIFHSADTGATWTFIAGPSGSLDFVSAVFVDDTHPGLARLDKNAVLVWQKTSFP